MPRDGSITFSDLTGKLDTLRVTCAKCGREGRYSVARLIERHGAQGKLTDWLSRITAVIAQREAWNMSNPVRCAVA